MELMKGSLNTFLNAFTYPDRTCYPVASCNLQVSPGAASYSQWPAASVACCELYSPFIAVADGRDPACIVLRIAAASKVEA